MFNMLFYNMCPHPSIGADTLPQDITDVFYLITLPWFKLHSRNIESFRRDGTRAVIGLEGESQVELDWNSKTYRVVVDGIEVARDESTYCPLDKDKERIAFYSTTQKELTSPLPKGWSPASIRARALAKDGAQKASVVVRDQTMTVLVPARQPIIVDRGAASRGDEGDS